MPKLDKILVPIDFSDCSRAAALQARILAEAFSAQIELLHVWQLPSHVAPLLSGAPDDNGPLSDVAQTRAHAALSSFEGELRKDGIVASASLVIEGDPAEVIIETAKSRASDLIALGTHGRTGLAHLLLGSVAEKVVRLSPVPVLTVQAKASVAD